LAMPLGITATILRGLRGNGAQPPVGRMVSGSTKERASAGCFLPLPPLQLAAGPVHHDHRAWATRLNFTDVRTIHEQGGGNQASNHNARRRDRREMRLCQVASRTERPCWRPATEADLDVTEPTLCALDMQVRNRTESMDGNPHAIEAMQASIKSSDVEEDPFDVLHELALGWYEELTEKAAKAAHKLRVAEFLASKGPKYPGPENSVMREDGAHL
jgi:hypothetical protein